MILAKAITSGCRPISLKPRQTGGELYPGSDDDGLLPQ